jgi:hypothetical protein
MGKKLNAAQRAAKFKNNQKNPRDMKPQVKSDDTTIIEDEMCPACELRHQMCTHLLETIKKKPSELPSKDVLSEFRHMCLDVSECCGNPYNNSSEYSDESGDEVFWKEREKGALAPL